MPSIDQLNLQINANDLCVILDLGAADVDPNLIGKTGRTLLMTAASHGFDEAVMALIEIGANVNVAGEQGITPLHEAASNGHSRTAQILIQAGALVNVVSFDGVTPLMCAAAWGFVDVAKILIKHGADAALRDRRGATAYEIASEKGEDLASEFLATGQSPAGPS